MSIGLHTNSSGQKVARLAGSTLDKVQHTQEKLSSGKRIVRGYDDAGGFSVAQKMGAEVKHKLANYHTLQNAFSFLQSQDGVIGQMQNLIERMVVLRTQYSDIIKTTSDKEALNHEFETLQDQLLSMREEKFNGISLFDMKPVLAATGGIVADPGKAFDVETSNEAIGKIRITRHGIFENLKAKYGADAVLNTQATTIKAAYDGGDGGTGSNSVLPTVKFSGGGGGVGASAVVTVNDIEGDPFQGKITSVTLTNPGTGYTSNPTVAIAGMGGGIPSTIVAVVDTTPNSPTEGQILRLEGLNSGEILSYNTAIGSSTPTFNSNNFIRDDGGSGYTGATAYAYVSEDTSGVQNVTLDNLGKGYAYDDSSFSVTFENGGGYGAKATANVVNGEIDSLTLTDGGQDYSLGDFANLGGAMVSFTGGGGRGAKFTANIDTISGQISGFTKIDGGADYTSSPTVRIASAGGYDGTGEPAMTTIQTSPTGTQIIDTADDPINITSQSVSGSGFATTVAIASPGGGGTAATANAVIDYDPTSANFGQVTGLALTGAGSGYSTAPTVTITGPGGNTSASYNALTGRLRSSSIALQGSGYDATTQLEVVGGGGSGATVSAVLTDDGSGTTFSISGISITNAGSGYTSNPVIQVKAGTGGGGSGFSATGTGVDQITGFQKVSGGTGYAPTITVDSPDDPSHPQSRQAVAIPVIDGNSSSPTFGEISTFTLIDGGRGYVDDSFSRNITVSFAGNTVTATASIDPGEINFQMDDNGTPSDETDDFPIIFQTDTNGYDTHGTGYSTVPDVVISAPTFNSGGYVGQSIQASATATTNEGEVQAIATSNAGTGFAETASLAVGGATGTGASILVGSADANTGTLQSISMDPAYGGSPGTGYQVGDPVIFTGNGHGNPQAEVASVNGSGAILSFNIINGGSGFQPLAINIDAPPTGGGSVQSVGSAAVNSAGEVTGISVRHHGFGYDYEDGNPDSDVATGGDTDPTIKIGDDTENWEDFGGNPIAVPDYVSIYTVGRYEPNTDLTFTRRDENGIVYTKGAWRHDPGPDGLYQFPAAPPHGLNSPGLGNDIYQDQNTEQYTADFDNNNDLMNPLFKLGDFSIRDFEDFMETLSNARATNAASSQRITYSIGQVIQSYNDLDAAHGRINQADIALEMGRYNRSMILGQATMSFAKSASKMHEIAFKLLKEGL